MFGDHRCSRAGASLTQSLEGNAPGFPMKRMREHSCGRCKACYVRGHIIRLDDVLRIIAVWVSPAANLDVYFAVVLVCARVIKCEHNKSGRGLELRSIAHGESIRSIS